GAMGGAPGSWGASSGGSYLAAPPFGGSGGSSGGNMANTPLINQGGSSVLYAANGTPLSAAQTQEIMRLYQGYEQGDMKSGQAAVQWAQSLGINLDQAVSDLRQGTGFNAPAVNNTPPESAALAQMAKIDPASEALRAAVANSYLTPLQQAGDNLNKQPTAADYQSYLDLFKQ